MRMPPMAHLSLVLSLATLAAVGCQQERAEVGGSAGAQGPAAQAGSGGSGGDGGGSGDGGGGEGGATGSGGGATGAGGGSLAEACGSFCEAAESLPCYPEDCVARCTASPPPGCEAAFAALLSCATPNPGNLSCSGGEVELSPEGCPDEYAALEACL